MQPFRMSALELIRAYRTRELSPVEAMTSVIGRVEAFEPHIHATWLYAPERALKEARASEARWAKGEPVGLLDGVPVTVKDNIATRGEPTPVGTAASDMTPAKADAPPAARLREAGAIIFAKTTMPDYGMLSSGLSSHHPLARNPWKLDRNPADRPRARAPRRRRSMVRSISGPISAARCGCRPAGAAFRPQTERRPRADRTPLHRPRRRADDALGGRCRLDDGDPVAAGRARLFEPQIREARLGGRARFAQGLANRSDARGRLRRSADAASPRRGRARGS